VTNVGLFEAPTAVVRARGKPKIIASVIFLLLATALMSEEYGERQGAGYAGTTLMRKVFHPETGALAEKTLVSAEREADMHLFAGAIGHASRATDSA
jgi:hypothetical protein